MKTRSLLLLLIAVVMMMHSGCQREDDLTEMYPALFSGIEYSDSTAAVLETVRGDLQIGLRHVPFEEENKAADHYYDDSALQEAIKKHTRGMVLDNDAEILAYAWDIQPILQDFSYLPSDCFPVSATRYSNGVVEICFSDDFYIEYLTNIQEYWNVFYDFSISVFVSAEDGHIIYISPSD